MFSAPYVYRRFPAAAHQELFRRKLGVEQEICDGAVVKFAGPVARCSAPWRWDEYTGQPRFCSADLWCLRAWALALGGVESMEAKLRGRLYDLEG